VSDFQRALTAAFEAGPVELLDLRIDQLDSRSRAEPVRLCLTGVNLCVAAAAG